MTLQTGHNPRSTLLDGPAGPGRRPGDRTRPLLLASRSPRRRQLLAEHGYDFLAQHPGIDDASLRPGSVPPDQWVASLAYLKAAAGVQRLRERRFDLDRLVVGADTVVVKDGRVIGQPADAADARRVLRALRDGEHEVLTGVAIIDPLTGKRDLFVDRATVRVGHVSDEEIERYIDSGRWAGKAGAYNLRERLEAGWPIVYDGDPTSVMGLPMRALARRLAGFDRLADRRGAVA